MPDHAIPELPRIGFVFGDEASAAHVQEAMQDHADIVYAAPAASFDLARLREADACALLVNVDGGDWLERLETALHGTGVAVVFNDPDISARLEGWDRARWRRHLLAKMRGSHDFDPPRPAMAVAAADQDAAPLQAAVEPPESVDATAERPLSPHEIETMTADFAAVPPESEPQEESPAAAEPPVAEAVTDTAPAPLEVSADAFADFAATVDETPVVAASVETVPEAAEAGSGTVADLAAEIAEAPVMAASAGATPAPAETEVEAAAEVAVADVEPAALDVDTETLSAMIDARLAEPAPQADEPGEVWCIADDAAGEAAQPKEANMQQDDEAIAVAAAAAGKPRSDESSTTDEVDVLAGLPSLDDWQLVDPDVVAAPTAASRATPAADIDLSGSLVGIELVPMEVNAPVQVRSEPIEFWLNKEDGARNDAASQVRKERQA